MTVIRTRYSGKPSVLGRSPSVYVQAMGEPSRLPLTPVMASMLKRMPKDSLLREFIEFLHGLRDDAPLHAARHIDVRAIAARVIKEKIKQQEGALGPHER